MGLDFRLAQTEEDKELQREVFTGFIHLLETDAPVLGPNQEERNEPSNLLVSLKAISEMKDIPEQEVREAVSENTRRLYGQLPVMKPGPAKQ